MDTIRAAVTVLTTSVAADAISHRLASIAPEMVAVTYRADTVAIARVLDRCRIRWGTVEAVDDAHVTVGSRPLLWDEQRLTLGPERVEYAGHGGDSAVSEALTPGDVVALHWDYVCDVLTPQRLERLVRENDHHLPIVNGAAGRLADRLVS